MNDKIMIAMSGGVDSSVAAFLCMEKANIDNDGYAADAGTVASSGVIASSGMVAGATMKLLSDFDEEDAKKVCDRLGIPLYVFDERERFKSCVIDSFVESYKEGATPNPCVTCNRMMKFGSFYDEAKKLGYNKIATGHYAQVEYSEELDRYVLRKASDLSKDQSYVLYPLSQEQLAGTVLPLGGLSKDEVRQIASTQGFENANKKESQDICFVPDGDYSRYIEEYTSQNFPEGDFVDRSGNVLGRHKGIIRYTIGQRRGLGLALKEPMYVCEKDIVNNKVVLCRNDELFGNTVIARDINLITVDHIDKSMRIKAKIRYNMTEQPAVVAQPDKDMLKIVFDEPQRAIAKGQSVVMYDGDMVVGGGIIS